MATRLRTVEHWLPMLTTAVDVTDTNFTQTTLYLPETKPSTPFKSVVMEAIYHDRNTTVGNVSRCQLSISVGGATYTVVNNTNAITNGGEQQTCIASADFTAHFNTNWTSGASQTIDARILLDSAVASPLNPAFSNISVRLIVTYEYDDTSTTQVKTVWIPLNAPVSTLATTKPGTATDTIPALDTYCPEASKTFRQRVIVVQGNDQITGTTDGSITWQVDTDTAYTSQTYEHGSTVSMFVRNHSIETAFTTNATHGFYLWASAANWNHPQAWMVVTYEFDASASNDMLVSLLLPMEVDSPFGATTSSDYQRATRDLWIQEPGTPTIQRAAAFVFWDQLGAVAGLNMRIGTGSFVTYTDAAAVLAGSNACMVRNDAAFTLARGKNTGNFDVYTTDTTDIGYNVNVLWMVNYTCGKPTAGYGAANHTVIWGLRPTGTAAAAVGVTVAATSFSIPEADYFISGLGMEHKYMPSSASPVQGVAMQAERLSGEGGIRWEAVYADLAGTDGETGIYHVYAQARSIFMRYPGDTVDGNARLDLETARRYRAFAGGSIASFFSIMMLCTYHTITYTVGGNVSSSDGGTVTLTLMRPSDGMRAKQTTRVGDGAYSFTWYDNTSPVFVEAREADGFVGRSDQAVATGSP